MDDIGTHTNSQTETVRTQEKARHLMQFFVPADLVWLLVSGLYSNEFLRLPDFTDKIPADAKLLWVGEHLSWRCFVFTLEHHSFPEVPIGCTPPTAMIEEVKVQLAKLDRGDGITKETGEG